MSQYAPCRVSITDHPVDRVVCFELPEQPRQLRGVKRQAVRVLTEQSKRNMVRRVRNYGSDLDLLITLTCPGRDDLVIRDGLRFKRVLNAFFQRWRKRGLSPRYFWFFEFQRRGAPHVHIFADSRTWGVCMSDTNSLYLLRSEIATAWTETYCQDFSLPAVEIAAVLARESARGAIHDFFRAGTSVEVVRNPHAAAAYAVKEGAKAVQKVVPPDFTHPGRFWGVSRNFNQVEPVVQVESCPIPSENAVAASRECRAAVARHWSKFGIHIDVPVSGQLVGGWLPGQSGADLRDLFLDSTVYDEMLLDTTRDDFIQSGHPTPRGGQKKA